MTTSRRAYPSDLSDARWALIEPIVAGWRAARAEQSLGINQPICDLRDIANAAEALGRGADVRMDGPTSATCPKFRDSPGTFRHDDPLGHDRQHVPATHRGIDPNLANPGTRGPARIRQLRLERLQMPSQMAAPCRSIRSCSTRSSTRSTPPDGKSNNTNGTFSSWSPPPDPDTTGTPP